MPVFKEFSKQYRLFNLGQNKVNSTPQAHFLGRSVIRVCCDSGYS